MIPLGQMFLSVSISLEQSIYLIIAIMVLVLFSSFFSASETAFSTTNAIRMRKLADDNVKGARKALNIIENYDKTLSAILVGNNLVNIANTTICAYLFSVLIFNPTVANLVNTVIMTIIILIFGEILPKSFAKANPEKFALRFSGLLYVVIRVLSPITFPFYHAQKAMLKNVDSSVPTVTEDDLEGIIDTMEEEGVLNSADADLFMGVLDINEKTVYDIMTPRVDVVAVSATDTPKTINETFIEHGYSRLPVYEKDKDHMVGILNYKDYFKAFLDGNNNIQVKSLMTQTTYVAENMKVKELIRIMQKEKRHLAIVLDEHGGTSGIVTMEDALEEMVGEIYDEHDESEEEHLIVKLSENTYEVDAEIEIEDLFEELNIEHLPDTEYSTVGGYLYELAENLPLKNQVIEVDVLDDQLQDDGEYRIKRVKLAFTLSEVENNRIRKTQLTVETLADPDEQEE